MLRVHKKLEMARVLCAAVALAAVVAAPSLAAPSRDAVNVALDRLRAPPPASTSPGAPLVVAASCVAGGAPWQTWVAVGGTLTSSDGTCLTAVSWPPVEGTGLVVAPCESPPPPQQQFAFTPSDTVISLTTTSNGTQYCANLSGYGTAPGTQVRRGPSARAPNCEQMYMWAVVLASWSAG